MESKNPIRVLLVDDHDMVRRGLGVYLMGTPDLELIGEANRAEQAIEMCARVHPDVILMDLIMPGLGGVAATRIIRQKWPDIKIVALTSFQEKHLVQEALQAGVISYLLKNVSCDALTQAIRAAHCGKSILAPEATQALVAALSEGPPPGQDLTQGEREVLTLMVEGLTNAEIAEYLHFSYSTARARVSSILFKMGVNRRAEAITLALRHQLVT